MTTSKQEEQAGRRRVILENARASTLLDHAQSQANDTGGGRFAALGTAHVVGSAPIPKYPAASAHQRDPVPEEPPLDYSVEEMPSMSSSIEGFDPAPADLSKGSPAVSPSMSEHGAGSTGDLTPGDAQSITSLVGERLGVGSSPSNKRSE